MTNALEVEGLCVTARDEAGRDVPIVKDIGFSVARGEVAALIGESGSGKTTIALSLMGYARMGCRIAKGSVRIGDTDVLALPRRRLSSLRGHRVTYIPQSAAAAFNPSRRIMAQVVEGARIHDLMSRSEAEAKAIRLFRALALPDPEAIGSRFPHQVSGGQLQRLIAAMALLPDPELVLLDEPTTALDVTTQIEVLRAFKKVVRDLETTAIYVSHDLAVVAQMADRIIVLRDGEIREEGTTERVLAAPTHEYTRSLLRAAEPRLRAMRGAAKTSAPEPPVLRADGILAGYGGVGSDGRPVAPILHDLSFSIERGSVLGVVGESGCGKSTLARVVAGLLPAARGSLLLDGRPLAARAAERTRDQLRRIQIVFQMADTALNPSRTVRRILERPLAFYHGVSGHALSTRAGRLLDMVHLPAHLADRYPGELSGGQKQRVNLARALAAEPDLILCDEVTSSLDSVVGAAVLELLDELRHELRVAYMFISHDLSTVSAICDQVMILYAGHMVELGGPQAALRPPMHPYADLLISSVPELRPGWLDSVNQIQLGEVASGPMQYGANPGCIFFKRCAARIDGVCDTTPPPVRHLSTCTEILCHRTEADLLAAQSHPTRVSKSRPATPRWAEGKV